MNPEARKPGPETFGLSYREIAERLDISPSQVYEIEQRALRKMRKLVDPSWRAEACATRVGF
jgi:DNA-directed RNA polymerase specialized sigma24 family protein